MSPLHRRSLRALTATCLAAGLVACDLGFENTDGGTDGGGNGGGEEEVTAQEYVAPDNWRLSLEDDGDFELEERSRPVGGTRSSSGDGEYEELSSGFSLLTMAASGVTGSAPAANSELGALAVDDDLMFVRNWVGGAPQLIPFVASDTCPSSRFLGNWVQLIRPNADVTTNTGSAFFGDVTISFADLELESERRFALITEFNELEAFEPLETDECESGVIETNDMTVFFGENGTALIHQNIGTSEESLWLALPQDPLTSDDLNADYVGYWVDYGRSTNDQVWPGTLACNAFDCTFERITDIADTTTLANQSFTIELNEEARDDPISGFITGNSSINEGTSTDVRPIACIASDNFNDTGDKVLVCVGQSPSSDGLTVNGFFVAAD